MGALLELALGANSPKPDVAPERERRIEQAVRMLRETPPRRSAFIAGQESNDTIPVTVAIRTSVGSVTGDLVIPKDRWDPWLFLHPA